MRTVFFGTPDAAIPSLHALAEISQVLGVITRPDAARGRSNKLVPSSVARAAGELAIPVFKPARRTEIYDILTGLGPLDVGVVVAYGMILPEDVLVYPAAGLVNVHFSLLPHWRGAAPVERAILAGEIKTGVSIMAMDAGLDTGAIISSEVAPIADTESAGELTTRLAEVGARLLSKTLAAWTDGRIQAVRQDDSLASYASKLTTAESRLSFTEPSASFVRKVRAFQPRPGAHAYLGDDRFKVIDARLADGPPLSPGHLLVHEGQLWVGTADGAVLLLSVQPAGKPVMDAAAWARGHQADIGRLT